MEKLILPYSLKNIPIPSRRHYQKILVSKVESFVRRIRWKLYHILNPSSKEALETFGFKTTNSPPQISELKAFEEELFGLVASIQFKPSSNEFTNKLKEDKQKILSSSQVIVKADKSSNLYMMDADSYKKKVLENITTDYRKCPRMKANEVTSEAAEIARKYQLEDRIDIPTEDESFITVKDHKAGFPGRIQCRLINPAKNHIGTISKSILDKSNTAIRSTTKSNQWQNTQTVIKWLKTSVIRIIKHFLSLILSASILA